jgi:proteasome accessory factor C
MSRTARRLTRILSMVPWVIAHQGVSVGEVCERFGYTERELLEDLNLVFVCGLPGYGPGDLMVAYVENDEVVVDMADYFSRPLRLTPAEALGLLASGSALVNTSQAPDALERAVGKLAAALGLDADETVVVDLAGESTLVRLLREGVTQARVIVLTYTSLSKGETRQRMVEPWSVFSTLGNWYLSGFCRTAGGERIFRVDRIQDAVLTEEAFTPPAEPPPPEVRYTPSEDDVRATISIGERARWVAEYYPVEVVSDSGSEMVIEFSAADPSVAARLLLRLGTDARLIEGPETRAALEDLRSRILTRYGDRQIPH